MCDQLSKLPTYYWLWCQWGDLVDSHYEFRIINHSTNIRSAGQAQLNKIYFAKQSLTIQIKKSQKRTRVSFLNLGLTHITIFSSESPYDSVSWLLETGRARSCWEICWTLMSGWFESVRLWKWLHACRCSIQRFVCRLRGLEQGELPQEEGWIIVHP